MEKNEEEEEEALHPQSRDSSAVCGADHDKTVVPLQPMEFKDGANILLKSIEDPTLEQVWPSWKLVLW